MKNPVLDYCDNLVITRTGSIWATWEVTGLAYPYKTLEEKKEARDDHKALFRALKGEALILGLAIDRDPADIALAMTEGIDLDANPSWRDEVEAQYQAVQERPLSGELAYFLSVPLHFDLLTKVRLMFEAALAGLAIMLGLPRWSAGRDIARGRFGSWAFLGGDIMAKAREASKAVQNAIPAVFEARPVSRLENTWIVEHSQQRGIYSTPRPVGAEDLEDGQRLSGRAVAKVEVHEGIANVATLAERLMPWRNRYFRLQSEDMDEPSWQVAQVFAGVPAGGHEFPGVEWVHLLSKISDRSDFAIRLQFSPAAQAKRKNRTAEKNLEDQEEQRSDSGRITGRASELAAVGNAMVGYVSELNASEQEVEVQSTTIVFSYGPTAEAAVEEAENVRKFYAGLEFRLTPPIGYQEELWWQAIPGTPTRPVTREYAQIQSGAGFSASMPLTTASLGHNQGMLLAENITTAHTLPVLLDPAVPMLTDGSGSFGICAELGAGKSFLGKKIAGAVADRGGKVMALDRSQNGEWESFAASVPGSIAVRVIDPEYSLDPLRIFAPERAARAAQGFFGTLLDIAPMSDEGAALSAAIDPRYLRKHNLSSSGELLEHLKGPDCEIRGREQLTARMDILASKDYGAVIFDPLLPPMPTDARMTVFRTIGVSLPSSGELAAEHRFRNLPIEKKFGSSVYQLIMEISRELCLADPQQLAVFLVDEAHHLTGFPAGEEAVEDFLRVARRDLAFLVLMSHDPAVDFGSETLRGLIAFRILMRHTSKQLATRGLEFLGLNPNDEELLDLVTKDLSPKDWKNPASGRTEVHPGRRGEALMRDDSLRYGKIRVLAPARTERAQAALTTPSGPVREAA